MCKLHFLTYFLIHHYAKHCYTQFESGMSFVILLFLYPNKLFSFITDKASAENNCEEQQCDDSQPETQDKQLATNSEAKSSDRQIQPEDLDLLDRSSQSSFASVDGTGKYTRLLNCLFCRLASLDSTF